MRKTIASIGLLAVLTLMCACGSTYYSVTTNSGHSYVATEKPKLDEGAKTYTFIDNDGHKVILNQSEIAEIKSLNKK